MKAQVFTIVPGANGPLWLLLGVSALLLAMVGLFAWLAWSSRHTQFEVSGEGLRISNTMYGRTIPLAALSVDGARVLNLDRDLQYRAKWRSNGAGLPGYQAGWFKLRNSEKSLLFVTDKSRVVYVPTRKGYSVLLSVNKPEQFVDALRAAARTD
ncbi:MAG: PH domain-containing protein [Candidatus Latescibacterota bacterium]|jgi:hypothetical protein